MNLGLGGDGCPSGDMCDTVAWDRKDWHLLRDWPP